MLNPQLAKRRRKGRAFRGVIALASLLGLCFLIVLLARVWWEGGAWLSLDFLRNPPSVLNPPKAGVKSALWGTIWLITITIVVSVPLGVSAAIYLEEYAPNNRITRFIHLNIANLAGVPSIVYGILALALFVRYLDFDRSVLSGGLTLSLLIMPVIIIASREALLAVPQSFRHAAYALGASRWQTIRSHVLPAALPGITTGVILAVSRAIGEAAPLLILGALTYVTFVPEGLLDAFTALPLQIYDWADRPQADFHHLASAGILVLLGILLPLNGVAVALRAWHARRKMW